MSETAIMLCGHGSRDEGAITEFAAIAERLRERVDVPLEHGFLEFATPIIRDGLDKLRDGGAKNILAVPGMLFAAGHVKNDVPSVLNTYMAQNDGLTIKYGRDLGIDTRMVRPLRPRHGRCRGSQQGPMARCRCTTPCWSLSGAAASDPDANSNVAKVGRMLWEGLGFGWGEIAYSGVTFPLSSPACAMP